MLKWEVGQIILCLVFTQTRQCEKKSFSKIMVWVQEKNREGFQAVEGCITPDKLRYDSDSLKKIKITKQSFRSLRKGAVANISSRFSLIINHNPNLTEVMDQAFVNIPNVLEIDLNNNAIEWIESNTFSDQLALEAIDLSDNHLEMLLHHTFYNLPSLNIIDLSRNKFQFFNQYWFHNALNLSIIFLYKNRISSLPRAAFVTLPSLSGIDLSDNQITHIHTLAFEGLQDLVELYLGENKLKNIELDFTVTPNLVYLQINENQINYISETTLSSLQHALRTFDIHFNPWQCSCVKKMIDWGAIHNVNVNFKCKNTNLFCVLPKVSQNECADLSAKDFHDGCLKEFEGPCKKLYERKV